MNESDMPADPADGTASLANDNEPARPAGKCPVCRKPRVERYRPFCSRRCADVDLARWLGGHYSMPAATGPEDDSED